MSRLDLSNRDSSSSRGKFNSHLYCTTSSDLFFSNFLFNENIMNYSLRPELHGHCYECSQFIVNIFPLVLKLVEMILDTIQCRLSIYFIKTTTEKAKKFIELCFRKSSSFSSSFSFVVHNHAPNYYPWRPIRVKRNFLMMFGWLCTKRCCKYLRIWNCHGKSWFSAIMSRPMFLRITNSYCGIS